MVITLDGDVCGVSVAKDDFSTWYSDKHSRRSIRKPSMAIIVVNRSIVSGSELLRRNVGRDGVVVVGVLSQADRYHALPPCEKTVITLTHNNIFGCCDNTHPRVFL